MKHQLKHHIPDHWTADMALSFVGFLDQLVTAVWDQHGPAMADLLRKRLALEPEDLQYPYDPCDEEIPF